MIFSQIISYLLLDVLKGVYRKIEIAEEQLALEHREVEALEDIRDFLQETCNITIEIDDKLNAVDNTTDGVANGVTAAIIGSYIHSIEL